jgi:hypothetical protein
MKSGRRFSILFAVASTVGMMASCTPQPVQSPPAIFRIRPVRPIEELRREALLAQPPVETGKLPSDLVDVLTLDPTIRLDIKYATTDNFLSTKVYEVARAMLQRPAAEALVRAHRALAKRGYGVLIHDAYRPWFVTKIFWDATPIDRHEFVADPGQVRATIAGVRSTSRCSVCRPDGRWKCRACTMKCRNAPTQRTPAARPSKRDSGTCYVRRWRLKASRSMKPSGGTSTTRIGIAIPSVMFR